MSSSREELNVFLVKLFNNILKIEEDSLKMEKFQNLSVKEVHILDTIATVNKQANGMLSDVAKSLSITPGTDRKSVV